MKIFKKLLALSLFLACLLIYAAYNRQPGLSITNEAAPSPQALAVAAAPSFSPSLPQSVQVVKSLLGLEVRFLNGNVNYPGLTITNDPRYQALGATEKLVDAIPFQPSQASAFLLLIAIAKDPHGKPLIVPGKFDITHKTEQNGFVLKDAHGRLFYYSGYTLLTSAWQTLSPGQILQDSFCKTSVSMLACPATDTVKVILKKPADPHKDIPLLTFVR